MAFFMPSRTTQIILVVVVLIVGSFEPSFENNLSMALCTFKTVNCRNIQKQKHTHKKRPHIERTYMENYKIAFGI